MIKVNLHEVNVRHFPDGTQCLLDVNIYPTDGDYFYINWKYESDEECMTLWYIVNHIRSLFGKKAVITLNVRYLPNARMDRTKKKSEVFTLKWFGKFLDALELDSVHMLDPHSDVSAAVIENAVVDSARGYIDIALWNLKDKIGKEPFVMFFPDAGAMKRYANNDLLEKYNCNVFYGDKVRDWETGQILGLKILDRDGNIVNEGDVRLKDTLVLMVDDIISYGGTLAHSAVELKRLGAGNIYAYATHTENSIMDEEKGTLLKRLKDGTVKKVFTTDSIFNQTEESKPYIKVI